MGIRGERDRGGGGAEALDRAYGSAPPLSETVSEGATEAVTSRRISEEVATTTRPTLTESPAHWLDRLIVVMQDLPFAEGPESVMRAFIEALGAIIPECAVGIRMPIPGDADRDGTAREKAQKELRSEPPSGEVPIHPDTTRMFPELAHERSVCLTAELSSGALHFASADPSLDDDRAPIVHFLHRASLAAGDVLRRARADERVTRLEADLRALNMHMVQAEKLASLGQIAAGMVHELNNPLTSIVAYTDYLLRRAQRTNADPDDTERLRRIAGSANRMLRFTRDLVSYARPSSEVAVPVPLHTVIHQALAFCEHELSQAEVTVDCQFDPSVGSVRGMPEQLAQIFVNLVTNACHAMAPPGGEAPRAPAPAAQGAAVPEGVAAPAADNRGRLTISTELVDNSARVRVTVADTGHGISASHLPMVFAPFFTTKGAGRGTGLGLSIVKNIVENHSGTIRAESEPPRGTRFIVVLPAG
jgi:signal transduction histidine kinase